MEGPGRYPCFNLSSYGILSIDDGTWNKGVCYLKLHNQSVYENKNKPVLGGLGEETQQGKSSPIKQNQEMAEYI